MENALRANPKDVREQYEDKIKELRAAYGEAMHSKKVSYTLERGRETVLRLKKTLQQEGIQVSVTALCRILSVPRRTVYYQEMKQPPKLQSTLVGRIKAFIEEYPTVGYRTIAYVLGLNKNLCIQIEQVQQI